jgi:hypothetical protein
MDLSNDSASLAYDSTGTTKIVDTESVSTTASVYLNGDNISNKFIFT